MGIAEEVMVRLRTIIDGVAVKATSLGAGATIKKYGFIVLKDVVKVIEEHSIQGIDSSSAKKAAAMDYLGVFFDTVIGPKINVILRPFARQIYMYACSYAIDALVSYINMKLNGKFTELE